MIAPDIIVLGAMKSGTTTLYEDLAKHPHIHAPEKETDVLLACAHDSQAAANAYGRLFSKLAPGQRCLEVATTYSMRPHYEVDVVWAKEVLPPDVRLIYILRNPLARIVSHYNHERAARTETRPIGDAIREDGRYLAYSRYGEQLQPWVKEFGSDRIYLISFEEYVSNRQGVLRQIWELLELPQVSVDTSLAYNESDNKPVVVGWWRKIPRNRIYTSLVRPLLPRSVRRKVAATVLPRARAEIRELPDRDRDLVVSALREDVASLESLAGHPWWPEWR